MSEAQRRDFRERSLQILCIAGHAGLPQVSLPLATVDGLPVGLSLIAPRGADRALINFCGAIKDIA